MQLFTTMCKVLADSQGGSPSLADKNQVQILKGMASSYVDRREELAASNVTFAGYAAAQWPKQIGFEIPATALDIANAVDRATEAAGQPGATVPE